MYFPVVGSAKNVYEVVMWILWIFLSDYDEYCHCGAMTSVTCQYPGVWLD